MNLGTNLLGKFALFSISVFLVGCNGLKENEVNNEDSKKLSVEFSQSEVSIPKAVGTDSFLAGLND